MLCLPKNLPPGWQQWGSLSRPSGRPLCPVPIWHRHRPPQLLCSCPSALLAHLSPTFKSLATKNRRQKSLMPGAWDAGGSGDMGEGTASPRTTPQPGHGDTSSASQQTTPSHLCGLHPGCFFCPFLLFLGTRVLADSQCPHELQGADVPLAKAEPAAVAPGVCRPPKVLSQPQQDFIAQHIWKTLVNENCLYWGLKASSRRETEAQSQAGTCSQWQQQSWGSSPALPSKPPGSPASLSWYLLPGTQRSSLGDDGVPRCPETSTASKHRDKGVLLGMQPANVRPAMGPCSCVIMGAGGGRRAGMEGKGDRRGGQGPRMGGVEMDSDRD